MKRVAFLCMAQLILITKKKNHLSGLCSVLWISVILPKRTNKHRNLRCRASPAMQKMFSFLSLQDTGIHLHTCVHGALFCCAAEVGQSESQAGGCLYWGSSEFKACPGHIIRLGLNNQNTIRKKRKDRSQEEEEGQKSNSQPVCMFLWICIF